MTDVLGNTAGYIDSELSDYDDNYGESINSNYYYLNDKTNNSFNLKNNNYNYKSYNTNELVNPLSVNNSDVINDKYNKCVSNYQQKSPRFGRDDINNLCIENETNYKKINRELLLNRNSLDTVDSLTPLSNNFDKSFKWWKDDEFNNLESEIENTEVVNSPDNELRDESNSLEVLESDSNIEWRSWTVDNNDLLELRNKLMNKLLNHNSSKQDVHDTHKEDLHDTFKEQEDGHATLKEHVPLEWDELKFYKDLNKLLLDKMLYLLNNNNYNLIYNLNEHYVTSIQNHLTKVHNFLSLLHLSKGSKVSDSDNDAKEDCSDNTNNRDSNHVDNDYRVNTNNTDNINNHNTDNTDNNQHNNTNNNNNQPINNNDNNELERLKLENERLRNKLNALECKLTHKESENESNLMEKLKLVEENKNIIEEDFKKTLVYMRLMKDRLKQIQNINTTKPHINKPYNNINYTSKSYKNNSVRFNDTSELYVIPNVKLESKGIIKNENKFTKIFKIFS